MNSNKLDPFGVRRRRVRFNCQKRHANNGWSKTVIFVSGGDAGVSMENLVPLALGETRINFVTLFAEAEEPTLAHSAASSKFGLEAAIKFNSQLSHSWHTPAIGSRKRNDD